MNTPGQIWVKFNTVSAIDRNQPLSIQAEPIVRGIVDPPPLIVLGNREGTPCNARQSLQGPTDAQRSISVPSVVDQSESRLNALQTRGDLDGDGVSCRASLGYRELARGIHRGIGLRDHPKHAQQDSPRPTTTLHLDSPLSSNDPSHQRGGKTTSVRSSFFGRLNRLDTDPSNDRIDSLSFNPGGTSIAARNSTRGDQEV